MSITHIEAVEAEKLVRLSLSVLETSKQEITSTEQDSTTSALQVGIKTNNPNALVIIDTQNEFISPDGNFPISELCRESVIASFKNLIPRFREQGGQIIWVKATYENLTEEPLKMAEQEKGTGSVASNEWLINATHVYHVPCCEDGSFGGAFYPDIFMHAEGDDAVLIKGAYSAFNGDTRLLETLREKGITNAWFCGVASGTCVLATVLDAVRMGEVKVNVVPDCMGWRRKETHVEALRRLKELNVKFWDGPTSKFTLPEMRLRTAVPESPQDAKLQPDIFLEAEVLAPAA
jgi:nicotinamidase-related amidase